MSFNVAVTNNTPFVAQVFALPTPEGQEGVVLVLAATFDVRPDGRAVPSDPQPAVRVADVNAGEPGRSSVLHEGEVVLQKPCVDVSVVATAYAPGGRPAGRVTVSLDAGDVRKALVVSGDREWVLGVPGPPRPFSELPIRYERAFGGTHQGGGGAYDRNPVGAGFEGAASADGSGIEVPNVEYPDQLVRSRGARPQPAGLTPIGRGWKPRAQRAGTYDDKWLETRWPLLPADYDPRHNQSVADDQQSRTIAGGEPVRLVNMTKEGTWTFGLPTLDVPVWLLHDDGPRPAALRLDTVVIEPDLRQVRLTARLAREAVRGRGRLHEVVLGHMTAGWRRAVAARKPYTDRVGSGGSDRSAGCWR